MIYRIASIKGFILGFIWLFVVLGHAQKQVDFKAIDSLGKAFTAQLRQGNVEQFKYAKPPKNTWSYSRLLEYKKDLEDPDTTIFIGDLIGPSDSENKYSYNLFAYKKSGDRDYDYYFAAIVSINISDGKPIIDETYLFTIQDSLKSWWSHIFGLYYTDKIEEIPKEFVYQVCPPPPFKEE